MSRPGISKKDCHGCGRRVPHFTDRVCDDCAAALKYAARMREAQSDPELVLLYVSEVVHGLPYLHGTTTETREPLRKAFHELSLLLSLPATGWPSQVDDHPEASHLWPVLRKGDSLDHQRQARMIPRAVADALRETYRLTAQAIEAANAAGHEDGANLLLQLAGGEITVDRFNDQALRRGGRS